MAARQRPTLYFAYGSNMNTPQMHARVPGSRLVGTGLLSGHEFLYSGFSHSWGGAVANVRPRRGSEVFGVLYELPPGGLATLDRFEGYPHAYQRKTAPIEIVTGAASGQKPRAVLYFKRETRPLAPPAPEYVALIHAALRRHGAL